MGLARAFRWKAMLESGRFATISELAAAKKLDRSFVSHLLRLTLLAPDLVEAILDGRQTTALQLQLLARGFPSHWKEQRNSIASPASQRHRLSFAHAVYMAGHLSELMDDWKDVQKANEESISLAKKWGLSGFEAAVEKRERLVAIALHSDPEQMDYKRRHPHPSWARPLHDGVLAHAFGCKGVPDEGLQIIKDSLAWADQTKSRFFDAELHRIRAGLLVLKGRPTEAELSYKSAIQVAREQNARLWELKAASDLAGMLRDQQRAAEAHEVLAPIYSWFTEGFSFPELQAARALLATLSPSPVFP